MPEEATPSTPRSVQQPTFNLEYVIEITQFKELNTYKCKICSTLKINLIKCSQ